MSILNDAARELLCSGRLAHLVTIDPDGSPQVTIVWTTVEGDEILIGHLMQGRKIMNIQRDPRVAISVEAEGSNEIGLAHYLVVRGSATLTPGGAPELLGRLAKVYLGPDVRFPPFDNPPPGHVIRIKPEAIGGVGPWSEPR